MKNKRSSLYEIFFTRKANGKVQHWSDSAFETVEEAIIRANEHVECAIRNGWAFVGDTTYTVRPC